MRLCLVMGLRPKNKNLAAHHSFPVSVSFSKFIIVVPFGIGVRRLEPKNWNIFFHTIKKENRHPCIPPTVENMLISLIWKTGYKGAMNHRSDRF